VDFFCYSVHIRDQNLQICKIKQQFIGTCVTRLLKTILKNKRVKRFNPKWD
jgi:hypothetical protein